MTLIVPKTPAALQTKIALGSFKSGDSRQFHIDIVNPTFHAIDVESIPGCGCTTLAPQHAKIPPMSFKKFVGTMKPAGDHPGSFQRGMLFRCYFQKDYDDVEAMVSYRLTN